MAVIPISIFGAQFAAETTEGTAVAASKRLLSLGFSRIEEDPMGGGEEWSGQGNQLSTVAIPAYKRMSRFNFDGRMSYNTDIYIYNSGIKAVSPVSDGTNGKRHSFQHSLAALDTRKTYTYENGSSTRAQKCAGAHVNKFVLEMSPFVNKISGEMCGLRMTDDIVITGSPTELSPVIIFPHLFNVKAADTQAGLSGASAFPLPLMARLEVPELNDYLPRMNSTDTSYAARVPRKLVGITLTFECGADDLDYANFLAKLDSGAQQWFQIQALGDVIAPDSQYEFTLQFCGALIRPSTLSEKNSAATNTFTFIGIYDPIAGFLYRIQLVNTLTGV